MELAKFLLTSTVTSNEFWRETMGDNTATYETKQTGGAETTSDYSQSVMNTKDDYFILSNMTSSQITTLIITPTYSTVTTEIMKRLTTMSYIMIPLLFVTGIVGNILTVHIMTSRHFRKYPVSLVLTVLAASDTVVNLLLPFNRPFVRNLIGDPRSLSLASCKLFYLTYRVARITSSWMVVIVTTERFVAVCFPSRAKRINTKRNYVIMMASIVLIIFAVSGYLSAIADILVNGVCIPNYPVEGKRDLVGVFLVLGFSLYAFIPSAILVMFNIMIILKLVAMKRKLTTSRTGSNKKKAAMSSKDARMVQTTLILLAISISFIILVNPSAFAHLTAYIRKKSIFEATDTGTVLYREISSILEQINNSVNFFFYVMGSRKFREHLIMLFKCQKRNNRIANQDNGNQQNTVTVAYTKDVDAAVF